MSRIETKPLHRTTTQGPEGSQIVTVRVPVDVPEAVYDDYAQQAMARGLPTERLMGERLTRARGQTTDALIFTAEQRVRFNKALGHTVSDAEGALQRMENQMKLVVADVNVPLTAQLIQRISTRAKAQRLSFEQCLTREVIGAIRRFTGLDPA